MHPLLNVSTSMLAGAAAVVWLEGALTRRRAGGMVPAESRLREQVQACVGRLVSHPDVVQVTVEHGVVRVSGPVLRAEVDRLLSQLTRLPGVHKVHNALSPVADEERLQAQRAERLQGEFGAGA